MPLDRRRCPGLLRSEVSCVVFSAFDEEILQGGVLGCSRIWLGAAVSVMNPARHVSRCGWAIFPGEAECVGDEDHHDPARRAGADDVFHLANQLRVEGGGDLVGGGGERQLRRIAARWALGDARCCRPQRCREYGRPPFRRGRRGQELRPSVRAAAAGTFWREPGPEAHVLGARVMWGRGCTAWKTTPIWLRILGRASWSAPAAVASPDRCGTIERVAVQRIFPSS